MFIHFRFVLLLVGLAAGHLRAALIQTNSVHLRSGDAPEWEQFAAKTPDGRRLDLTFQAKSNVTEATLFIRQDEVRQDWNVEVNGRRIGKLFTMEADLIHTLTVPAKGLKEGTNQLSLLPPRANDDIFIREIVLDPRPRFAATAEATLEVQVTEKGTALPSRITLTDSNGALAALVVLTNRPPEAGGALVTARPGVIYTGDGRVAVGVRAGTYTVYASRGFEYSVATQSVHVAAGETRSVALSLIREVATPGLVSSDTHIHTVTHSGHGDCTMEERMVTLAGEGLELPIATDHNTNISFETPAQRSGLRRWFTPVAGNEVTTPAGHFNIFPITPGAPVPDHRITDWTRLDGGLRATPGVRVVVLNHPRNVHNNFQPFAATNFHAVSGENRRGAEFQFDALELLNSSAQQSDHMLVYRDWFALLNYGYRVTGIGSSDSHDVSRYIVGQGRTYIAAADEDVSRIDVALACSNLIAGRALVSMGLLAQMTVDDHFRAGDLATNIGSTLRVRVQVSAPSWISARRIELFANGLSIRTHEISERDAKSPGVKAVVEWSLPRPAHDVHLVALATGPGVDAPFWATPKPYQPTSPVWVNRVFGVTNPIRIDADGDGTFTPARGYARRLVERHGPRVPQLVIALAPYDAAVAAQVAALCVANGVQLESPSARRDWAAAPSQVREGFDACVRGHW